ncbi:MAG: carbohydrate kinase [Paracoccaceae bacterium]|nr:MAG: carbohydrate kinase [Paracoccaceae bacterium]
MEPVLLCLDSGTTAVKAAAFDSRGRLVASAQAPNGALRRSGDRVEQDMEASRDEAFAVLASCGAQVAGRVAGIVLTGQGDGLWPVDGAGAPVGLAMTWLDGRARALVAELDRDGTLAAIECITGARPTAASQSLQLLWLGRHDPARFARIAHVLRLKEWVFLSLTGRMMAEPTAALPVWGDWRTGAMVAALRDRLGLDHDIARLPEFAPVGQCRAALAAEAAARIGVAAGVPVLLGPGDVQATLIGLGLGIRDGVTRASILGTSSIHACLVADPAAMKEKPAGAMIQPFVMGGGHLCFHPGFNGATVLSHVAGLIPGAVGGGPSYSALVMHPFLEPGGERAPWTSPHASGAMFGLTAETRPDQVAWAAREALAFVARRSHDMMNAPPGVLSLGGGLAGDRDFAQFLATVTGGPVQPAPGGQAGLQGLALLGARHLFGADDATLARDWIPPPQDTLEPAAGADATYAAAKFALFVRLVEATSAHWPALSGLRTMAETLMDRRSQ